MSVGSYNILPNRMYVVGVGGWTDRVMTWHPVHGECEALIATIVLSERNAHNWLSGLSLVVISLYVQQLFYCFVLKQSELLSSCFNYSTGVLLLIKGNILQQLFYCYCSEAKTKLQNSCSITAVPK